MNYIRAKAIFVGSDASGISLRMDDEGYRMSPTTAKSLSTCLKVALDDYEANYREKIITKDGR